MGGYAEYIQLNQLLALQQPRTKRLGAELTFIVAHQVYELWFKLLISKLEQSIAALDSNNANFALGNLRCIGDLERLMLDQLVLLEHLDPCAFAEIRQSLGSSSAAESEQFAHIEALSSCLLTTHCRSLPNRDLWTSFCDFAEREGVAMPAGGDESSSRIRIDSLHHIYASHDAANGSRPLYSLHELCEALLDHDEGFALWRYRHCLTAFRQIGRVGGTGGTAGVRYLERRVNRQFYPDIWEVRTVLCNGGRESTIERSHECPAVR